MRCGCYVKHSTTPKGRKKTEVRSWWHTKDTGAPGSGVGGEFTVEELLADGYVVCEGKIVADIKAEDEPYYGGSSATLTINYKCDTCGWSFYPHLPDSAISLSMFVTEIIEQVDAAPRMAAAKADELERLARRDAALAELEARKKKR